MLTFHRLPDPRAARGNLPVGTSIQMRAIGVAGILVNIIAQQQPQAEDAVTLAVSVAGTSKWLIGTSTRLLIAGLGSTWLHYFKSA